MATADIRAHALKTARGFLFRGVLVVPVLDELKAEVALLEREHRHTDLRLFGLVRHDVDELRDRLFFGDLFRDARHVVAGEITVDRLRGELPLRDALDDRARTHLRISAREDARAIGHERAVRDDRLALALADA